MVFGFLFGSLGIFEIVFLLPLIGMYFLPTIVAIVKKKNLILIPVLNLLLGWTIIGWIILLILSVRKSEVV